MTTCIHCDRRIVRDADGTWVDPEADGDDVIWRETCDQHDTFTAEHEPDESTMTECEAEGSHIGPIVPTGDYEIIDHGVGFFFVCDTCDAIGSSSIDLSDIDMEGAP